MRSTLLSVCLLSSAILTAQWSTDPANPMAVCNALNTQSDLQVVSDGGDGWFCFWTDQRGDGAHGEIYGQHLDNGGNSLWTANGQLIRSEPGCTVTELAAVLLDNGNVLIAYLYQPATYQDTLRAIAVDANGDEVWSGPTHITQAGSPVLGLDQIDAIATPGGAYIGWYDTYFGGSNGVNVTRITNDGALPWGVDGYAIPSATYGPFELHGDHGNGVIVQWRTGNGSGAHLMAMRVGADGTNVWPANVTTSAGSGGLNYAFNTTLDEVDAQLTAFVDMPHRIVMSRVDTSGALTFSPSPIAVCSFASDQDQPKVIVNNGSIFCAWTDNRPPANNRDLYMQKLDADGSPQWTAAGVPVIQMNTYIPTSGLIPSDNGAVIATLDGTVAGFSAMRVLADGTLAWPAPVAFCTPAYNPFYELHKVLPDGSGGAVAFWEIMGGGDLYAARIYQNGMLGDHTGVSQVSTSNTALQIFPSPTPGPLTVVMNEHASIRSLRVIDRDGRATAMPLKRNGERMLLDASALAEGLYALEVSTDAGTLTARFIIAK